MWNNDLGYVNLGNNRSPKAPVNKKIGAFADRMLFWWGVVIPGIALLLEANYHICARHFFDPFPTGWHSFLFALVPASNLLAWLALRANLTAFYGMILFANGTAIGVSILYTLMFMPIVPASLLYVWVFGLGLLGLAPMLSLVSLWKAGKVIEREAEHYGTYFNPHQVHHLGHIAILLTIIAVELPSSFTRVALGMAAEHDQNRSKQGLEMLRAFGSQEVMLRACYERSGRATDIVGSLYESHNHMNVDEARHLFYRTTGRTFNSFPIPENARATMQHIGSLVDDGAPTDEFDVDPDIAGEMVSGVSRGLTVSNSAIKADIDAEAAVCKIDWQMSFRNKSRYDREVRTRISLPPGGVINKAALIVDGVEYEATIMVREEAREVYKEAVAAKRNPLLVSTCGEDTVLVQAFPVPPLERSDVKLRLGIVAPLGLDRKKQGIFVMPQFEERNFQMEVPHRIEIASDMKLAPKWGSFPNITEGGKQVLKGDLDGTLLATGRGIVEVERNGNQTSFWCYDSQPWLQALQGANPAACCLEASPRACQPPPGVTASANVISERLVSTTVKSPRTLTVVLDGSYALAQHTDQIAAALKQLPENTTWQVLVADDQGATTIHPWVHSETERARAIEAIRRLHCVGGQDNSVALERAPLADATEAVLWIHGAQPVEGEYNAVLKSRLAQYSRGTIYDMQIASGPNLVLDGIAPNVDVRKVFRAGTVQEDLELLFQQWNNKVSVLTHKFEKESAQPVPVAASSIQPVAYSTVTAPAGFITLAPGQKLEFKQAAGSAETSASGDSARCMLKPALAPSPGPACIAPPVNSVKQSSRQTMPEMAQLWAYERIMADIKRGDYASEQEALELARRYHIVTPLSSAILVLDVPQLATLTPEPAPEEPLQRLTMDIERYNPFKYLLAPLGFLQQSLQQSLNSALSESFSQITGQLNRLNTESTEQSGSGYMYGAPQQQIAAPQEENYRADYGKTISSADMPSFAPSPLSSGPPAVTSERRDRGAAPSSRSEASPAAPSEVNDAFNSTASRSQTVISGDEAALSSRAELKEVDALSAPKPMVTTPMRANKVARMMAKKEAESFNEKKQDWEKDKSSMMAGEKLRQEGKAQAPDLQGAINGTAGPQGADSTAIEGVNTAGTVKEKKPTDPISALFAKPVPESDSWWLCGIALLMILFVALRARWAARKI